MINRKITLMLVISMLVLSFLSAGCGGGSGAQRVSGLSSDSVVKAFFEAAKAGQLNQAALYVSPSSTNNPQTVMKYLTGQSGLNELKKSNLLSLKKITEQGNYAVVVATLQPEQNDLALTVKPVALEKMNGEWYIIDLDKIYQDSKYLLLQQLLNKI
ncbi:MAG: hypothetical protein H6Q74_2013 [Firmicutes bacterium]|nr:hypothetical protein [Bacillota bacterium]